MFIDCYYLSNIVRQPNHIYYTSYDYMFGEFFYFDLNLCNLDNIRFNTYPYKVRVDSNDVFYIANNGLRALKFQIVEEVNILDWIEASSLKDRTKSHLKSICNGSVPQDKVLEFYDKTIITPTALLTTAQIFKLHAILSQKKYELPTITFSRCENLYYVRLLEFYNRPHTTTLTKGRLSSLERYNREMLYGSRDFESFTDGAISDFIKFYDYTTLTLFQTRRLSQEKFEEYCEYMLEEKGRIHHVYECVGAGYKILPKYKEHFYPYTIYSNPELALDLVPDDVTVRSYTSLLLLKAGYKIKGLDYSIDRDCVLVQDAKKIFMKNDYKYI